MPRFSQADRPIRVDTALGEDVLLLSAFNGTEAISRPFSFQLELLSVQYRESHLDDRGGE